MGSPSNEVFLPLLIPDPPSFLPEASKPRREEVLPEHLLKGSSKMDV